MMEAAENTTRFGDRSTALEVVAGHGANVVFAAELTQQLAVSEELITTWVNPWRTRMPSSKR